VELLLMQDEQMIEALTPYTAEKPLTDGIRARGVIRSFENLNVTRLRNPSETHPKLAVVITNEVLRPHAKSGGFSKLLGSPSVSRISCHANVDHFARVQEGDEEGEQRVEEEIRDREEVASPDLLRMGVNERPPRLSLWPCGTDLPHVLLNGTFRKMKAQLE